jgi:transketolase
MADMDHLRDFFGKELVEAGKTNQKIVVVSADLEDSTRAEWFLEAYPERFFRVGIAEQDMVGMAAGLAKEGFIAFVNSFAVFLSNRAYDMLRIDVCYNNTNVKVVCTHAGVNVGEDGATAQSLEDIALMRALPNMIIVSPADGLEARKATRAFVDRPGPMYLRMGRRAFPRITAEDSPFEIGKANILREGEDVTLIGCGLMVSECLSAAEILAKEGIQARVINMHTIKPLDEAAVVTAAKETGAIVTAEEHRIAGGMGSAVAEVVVARHPVPMEFVAVPDVFGLTGKPDELLEHFHLKGPDIAQAARQAVKRKRAS